MPRKPYNDQTARYNVIVPLEDSQVCDWMGYQRNVSMSVRFAIKKIIELFGMCDITCLPVNNIPSLPSFNEKRKDDEQAIDEEKAEVEVSKADAAASEVKSEQENSTAQITSDPKMNEMYDSLLDLS